MNTPHDNSGTDPRDDAALTPEERALAEQIARAAPQRGPSPALDASILRAARVAVAAPHPTEAAAAAAATRATSARRRTQRRRWPAVFGVAATLALAFGLAWQLRPVDEMRVMTSEAPGIPPRPEANAGGPSAEDQAAMAVQHDESSTEVAAQAVAAPEAATDALQAKASKQSAPGEQNEAAEVKQVFAVEPAPDAGNATQTTPSAAPAPAAPPPPLQEPPVLMAPAPEPASGILPAPAIAEPAPQAASDQLLYRINKERRAPAPSPGAMAAPAPAPAAASAVSDSAASGVVAPRSGYSSNESQQRQKQESEKQAQALDRIEVTGSRIRGFEDQPIDDEPPASADSPEVREAWLKRVRELVTQGDRDAARDSLREYRRRYPDAAIPDDLRPLLPE